MMNLLSSKAGSPTSFCHKHKGARKIKNYNYIVGMGGNVHDLWLLFPETVITIRRTSASGHQVAQLLSDGAVGLTSSHTDQKKAFSQKL